MSCCFQERVLERAAFYMIKKNNIDVQFFPVYFKVRLGLPYHSPFSNSYCESLFEVYAEFQTVECIAYRCKVMWK